MSSRRIILCSPFSGSVVALDQLADAVLARRLLGDGAAVEILGATVFAPAAATIKAVDATLRRVDLVTADGLHLTLQVGSGPSVAPTSGLQFTVVAGETVQRGQPLATLDVDRLAGCLDSLAGAMLITAAPPDWRVVALVAASGLVEAGITPLLTVTLEPNARHPGEIELVAPVSGFLVPLEHVPDPVFAQRLVGDGVSIDPINGEVVAPAAGVVTLLHASRHALTLVTAEGLELLLHVGIDTVGLRGEGFETLVKQGDTVHVGQPLLRFCPDLVGQRAASLLTQLLVANVERIAALRPSVGRVQAGRDVVCTVQLTATAPALAPATASSAPGNAVQSAPVVLPNPTGLHARPAAAIASLAKRYTSQLTVIRLASDLRPEASANARSLVAVLGLGTHQGDRVAILAHGTDAAEAAEAMATFIGSGSGEEVNAPAPPPTEAPRPTSTSARADGCLHGVSASSGLAIGRIHHLRKAAITVIERGETPNAEQARLADALAAASADLAARAAKDTDLSRRQILTAHGGLLADPDLLAATATGIAAGKSAAFAWQAAIQHQVSVLEGLDNPVLRERATDLRDVGRLVLTRLTGTADGPADIPLGSIIVAEELAPSDTSHFNPTTVLGFCTTTGGATSHVAILARSLGIPAVCGIDSGVLALVDGTLVVLDGTTGLLNPAPDSDTLRQAESRRAEWVARQARDRSVAHRPATTRDGVRIEVAANVTNATEASLGVDHGADGVGLLRSEFLFDHRSTAPSEEEQAEAYAAVARALGPERPLVVRTLDVGGDKPLPYLPLPREENPFLGLRGLRVSLQRPDLFRTQLRAILRAAGLARLHIMFPMVTSLDELRAARAILEEERIALGVPPVQVGVMIEVPAAALLSHQLAREADFFSIGTNDLTQYVLAMDRGHPQLARQADALHPAVLSAIRMTCEGARAHGRWVGVCGGLAGDELAVPALIGLGVDELSVPVPAIPTIKAAVARCDRHHCTALANELLTLSSAAEVRARLNADAEHLTATRTV